MKFVLLLVLALVPSFSFAYTYDVKAYGGAVCDGHHDDSMAVKKTYAAAAAVLNSGGSPGPVYWPPSSGPCVVYNFHLPGFWYGGGWLESKFDNSVYADHIYLASNNAISGGGGSFLNHMGSFIRGPQVTWVQLQGSTGPFVTIQGQTQVRVSGVNIVPQAGNVGVWQTDYNGAGCITIEFDHSTVRGDYFIGPSSGSNVGAGFGTTFTGVSIDGTLSIVNSGAIKFQDGYVKKVRIWNNGIASSSDFIFDNVLSETLSNEDFLETHAVGGEVSDITLSRVALADWTGNVWMLGNYGQNYVTNVKVDMKPQGSSGIGLVNPASTPFRLALDCHGYGCQHIERYSTSTLFQAYLFPPRNADGSAGSLRLCQYQGSKGTICRSL